MIVVDTDSAGHDSAGHVEAAEAVEGTALRLECMLIPLVLEERRVRGCYGKRLLVFGSKL